jgi:hypothetical protein
MINVAMVHAESNGDLSVTHDVEQIKNASRACAPAIRAGNRFSAIGKNCEQLKLASRFQRLRPGLATIIAHSIIPALDRVRQSRISAAGYKE